MERSPLLLIRSMHITTWIFVGILLLSIAHHPVSCWQTPPSSTSNNADIVSRRRSFLQFGVVNAIAVFIPSDNASAGIDVSGLRVEGGQQPTPQEPRSVGQPLSATVTPSSSGGAGGVQTIELAGISYTPAAMILQMAEQTASMEGMMRASAKDIQSGKTTKERIELGSKGQGPGVVRRQDLERSLQVMITNSKLPLIAPKSAATLEEIPAFLNKNGQGDMSLMEYQIVASKYEAAREELRLAFEKLSPEEQQEGRKIVGAIRARDMENMKRGNNVD